MRQKILLAIAVLLAIVIGSGPFLLQNGGDLADSGLINNKSNITYAYTGNAEVNTSNNQYSIEQAISDEAQLNTLAFSGLGFLTGDLCADSFLPPGKVADFFGFQYVRDTAQAGQGHSTDFLTNAANNVLYILNNNQKALMMGLAHNQIDIVNQFAYMRYPLMVAFRRQLDGTVPAVNASLSKEQVMNYSANLYVLDAQISIQRAQLYANILNSLNATQKSYLSNMVQGGFYSWPALPNQLGGNQNLTRDENVLVMTFASDIYAWYAGDIEADTYFCPERHADYFGGFYIKDVPAVGNPGYTINETITGDKGAAFIAALNSTQKPIITSLVDTCRASLLGLVDARRAIATELRSAIAGGVINETKVIQLETLYGRFDGEITYNYATAFAAVGKTLTSTQQQTLTNIRDLSNYPTPTGKMYLYSDLVDKPTIANTDFLFNTTQTTTPNPTANPIPEFTGQTPVILTIVVTTAVLSATLLALKRKQGFSVTKRSSD
jgi:hypothetical protein